MWPGAFTSSAGATAGSRSVAIGAARREDAAGDLLLQARHQAGDFREPRLRSPVSEEPSFGTAPSSPCV